MTLPEKDHWGRIPGMVHRAEGKVNKKGWYYKGEFIAVELREAYRILRERLKETGKMSDNYGHIQPSRCKTCKELAEDCECKRDRLLSEQEIEDIPPTGFDVEAEITDEDICKAQDTKTAAAVNAEWVEWIEDTLGDAIAEYYVEIWQERKKEKGI